VVEVEFLVKSADFKSANNAQILTLPVRNIPPNNIIAGIKMILSHAFDENPGWFSNFKLDAFWQKIFNEMCDGMKCGSKKLIFSIFTRASKYPETTQK
jgi:hypothetical protein